MTCKLYIYTYNKTIYVTKRGRTGWAFVTPGESCVFVNCNLTFALLHHSGWGSQSCLKLVHTNESNCLNGRAHSYGRLLRHVSRVCLFIVI